ncbi:MAG: TetR family transcriptional regulator [Acidimicrobiales bacterium]
MSRRRTTEEQAERRDDFLDAAVAVVRRDGASASMEAMAAEAGVTKPILYRVFGDRDGLLLALAARFATELNDALAPPLTGAATATGPGPEDDPREVLRATIDAYVSLIERDPELYRFLTERLATSSDRPIAGLADEVARNVAVVLGERLRAVGADSGAAEPWAYALVGMVHLSGDWWVNRRTMTRTTLVDYLVALVWDGLASLTPPTLD